MLLVAAFATGCGGQARARGTIVFQSGSSGREALYAARPDGSGLTRLSPDLPPDGAFVAWTRDGTKALVMHDTGSGRVTAYVFEPATRTRRRIRVPGLDLTGSNQVGDLSEMPWSPDGKRLLLATNGGDVVLDLKSRTTNGPDASFSWRARSSSAHFVSRACGTPRCGERDGATDYLRGAGRSEGSERSNDRKEPRCAR